MPVRGCLLGCVATLSLPSSSQGFHLRLPPFPYPILDCLPRLPCPFCSRTQNAHPPTGNTSSHAHHPPRPNFTRATNSPFNSLPGPLQRSRALVWRRATPAAHPPSMCCRKAPGIGHH
ncbi:hypothetical protein CALCODRAFT_307296 [Calocera cornea HHB12733]|uniref:Uncharacterized protein n=1 Tax=Calocera cornea HHB12733 TaxID=1353952 RepID=A0A165JMR0_9BASI|nr:hypothetical protein CALCODRAFT_307296 [Calocera cornea HHB12733]